MQWKQYECGEWCFDNKRTWNKKCHEFGRNGMCVCDWAKVRRIFNRHLNCVVTNNTKASDSLIKWLTKWVCFFSCWNVFFTCYIICMFLKSLKRKLHSVFMIRKIAVLNQFAISFRKIYLMILLNPDTL